MRLYCLYADAQEHQNSSRVNSVLVMADDEAQARKLAEGSPLDGESKCSPAWKCEKIADDATLRVSPCWIRGDVISLLGRLAV